MISTREKKRGTENEVSETDRQTNKQTDTMREKRQRHTRREQLACTGWFGVGEGRARLGTGQP